MAYEMQTGVSTPNRSSLSRSSREAGQHQGWASLPTRFTRPSRPHTYGRRAVTVLLRRIPDHPCHQTPSSCPTTRLPSANAPSDTTSRRQAPRSLPHAFRDGPYGCPHAKAGSRSRCGFSPWDETPWPSWKAATATWGPQPSQAWDMGGSSMRPKRSCPATGRATSPERRQKCSPGDSAAPCASAPASTSTPSRGRR